MMANNSEIIEYFNGKNIFLTGATGFVGKLLIDQLLRKCQPNKLYLLIRSKKGIEPDKRLEQLFQEVVYERLIKEKPDILEKVELINGDLSENDLGINETSLTTLIENVNVVIHGGATVRFDEHIKIATKINVKGTMSMIKLCHRIKKLEAFVYVSTAYSNCPYMEIKEEFYDPPLTCDELLQLTDKYSDNELEKMTEKIIGKWPNSYVFTKAVAENAVKTYATGLPVSVFRPAIIIGTLNEPIPGWIDNIYGPTGLLAGVAVGVVRVIHTDPNAKADIVPADMVASAIVAAAYKTKLMGPTNEIPIYNYVTAKENPITWSDYLENTSRIGKKMPLEKSVWKFSCTLQPNPFLFALYSFFLHFIPAALADIVLLLLNKKTGALKVFKKGGKFMKVLSYFSTRTWKFSNNNVLALWNGMNKVDKQLFNFNMQSVDWYEYFRTAVPGVRLYIFKESSDNIPIARRKYKRQSLIQTTILTLLYGFLAILLWKWTSNVYTLLKS
ncbi:fatty acyl-CoA reductase wat-like [Rhodnius prolixus]|uniref:fatty acyl-CoA reductase wat-like n=1 Tax=Rhodnius prolixus TaxID=13249 RepID=UPI003D188EF9